MSAGTTIGKAIAVLALFMVLINSIPAIANTNPGWIALQGAVQAPFPTFNNPFASPVITTADFHPSKPVFSGTLNTSGTDHGCAPTTWYDCLSDQNGADKNATTVSVTFDTMGVNVILFNVTGTLAGRYMTSAILEIQCYTPNGTTPVPFNFAMGVINASTPSSFYDAAQSGGHADICQNPSPSQSFATTTVTLFIAGVCETGSGGVWDTTCPGFSDAQTDEFEAFIMPASVSGAFQHSTPTIAGTIVVSTVTVHVTFSSALSTACTGDFFSNIGCQFGQAYDTLVKVGSFLINGVVFLGQAAFYFISIIGSFAYGILSSVAWVLLIPAPYSPPVIVQAIIDVFIFALMGSVLVIIISQVRGTGTVPV